MAAKKKAKKKGFGKTIDDPEELVAGLRRRRGYLPTKASEAARKKRKKKENG